MFAPTLTAQYMKILQSITSYRFREEGQTNCQICGFCAGSTIALREIGMAFNKSLKFFRPLGLPSDAHRAPLS